jgi:hypothetical protein
MLEAALFLRKFLDFLTFLFHFMLDPKCISVPVPQRQKVAVPVPGSTTLLT